MDELSSGPGRVSLAVLLRHAESRIRDSLQPALDEVGLSLDHWRILSVLHGCPGLRMTSLAAAAVVPNATLTRHMDVLVEHGLIVRRIDAADRRSVVAALSPRGDALVGRLSAAEVAVERDVFASLAGRDEVPSAL